MRRLLIQQIKDNVHVVISLLLFASAVVLALVNISIKSVLAGFGYLIISIISVLTISFFYCLKCPCRLHSCGHVFMSKITGLFTKTRSLPYTFSDVFFTFLAIVLLIGFPLYWLLSYTLILVVYICMLAIAGLEAAIFECKTCNNTACALNRKLIYKRKEK